MVKGKRSTRLLASPAATLFVGVLLAFFLSTSSFTSIVAVEAAQIQPVTISGILGVEVFNPACHTSIPPCESPSFVVPILLAKNNTIYALTSDNLTLTQQLLASNGSYVTVTGFTQPFNTPTNGTNMMTFTCSPYPCNVISIQISVSAFQPGSDTATTTTDQTTMTTDQTSAQYTPPLPGFEIPSILLGLR